MNKLTKTSKYSIGAFLALFIIIIALGSSGFFLSAEQKLQKEYLSELREVAHLEASDTFGGTTPEETLELFITALEVGDVELASKYFVLGEQGKQLENLKKIVESNFLIEMVSDLKREKYRNNISEDQVTFSIGNDDNFVALTILLNRNNNDLWKIESF